MSWMLFMDESGHDHRSLPYEVRGGIALHASQLWAFTRHIQSLEHRFFGSTRHDFGTEIKGDKLLKRQRFRYSQGTSDWNAQERKRLTIDFLKSTTQNKPPRAGELRAYSESCTAFGMEICRSLARFDAFLFAAFVPPHRYPHGAPAPEEYLRKDHVFLLERYFYFLEERDESGLLIMDVSEKSQDRRFVRGMERYFQSTQPGRVRSRRIVPVPMFVESDMGYGVQVADVCIYCLNNAYRVPGIGLAQPTRKELEPYAGVLRSRIWECDIEIDGHSRHFFSVVYVPDPYIAR